MKKLSMLVVALVGATSLFAQEPVWGEGVGVDVAASDRSYRISIGPKVGVNFSTMSGNPDGVDMGAKMGIGFHGGAVLNAHFGRRNSVGSGGTGMFGLQVEALYSQHTIKTDGSDNLSLSYFEVPVLFQFYPIADFCIEVGPTIAGTLGRSPDELVFTNATLGTKDLKGYDVKLSVGAMYRVKNGFTVGARYNLGTSDLAGNLPCKISAFQVSLGWMFNIIK